MIFKSNYKEIFFNVKDILFEIATFPDVDTGDIRDQEGCVTFLSSLARFTGRPAGEICPLLNVFGICQMPQREFQKLASLRQSEIPSLPPLPNFSRNHSMQRSDQPDGPCRTSRKIGRKDPSCTLVPGENETTSGFQVKQLSKLYDVSGGYAGAAVRAHSRGMAAALVEAERKRPELCRAWKIESA